MKAFVGYGKSFLISWLANYYSNLKICIIVSLIVISLGIEKDLYKLGIDYSVLRTNENTNISQKIQKIVILCVENSFELIKDVNFDLIIYDEAHINYKSKQLTSG